MGGVNVGKKEVCFEVGVCVFFTVERLDDGNAEDGCTVDVDIELG